MTTIYPILPISDLRYKTKEILHQVSDEPVVLTQRGRATAVLINFDTYNEMARRLQALEELRDEALMLLAQANLQEMEFVGIDALAELYQEQLGETLPIAHPA
jgi:prevent-host-death family protein